MSVLHFILATAGHVDHGKSALVRALTGIDPDRLPEEKARGITIELGFAHIDLRSPDQTETTYRLGIVDVPGHEDFVKNMVAGVGSIDLALLVVSAKDGWMPQTEEHLQILTYAGVSRGIVALTMADLVSSSERTMAQVREKLSGTPLFDAPIVITSAVSGIGLDALKASLASTLSKMPPQRDLRKPRLAVDRAFALRGTGTVVTGTLTGGCLRRGQSVIVQPRGTITRIRSIQSYNRDIEQATPGSRVALNLPDLHPGELSGRPGQCVIRGDVISLPETGQGSDTLDVRLEMSTRRDPKPLKDRTRLRVHHGSGNVPATVCFPNQQALTPGNNVLCQLRLESTVYAFAGDRFIVRDWSEQQTLAGGIVLDPDASRRGFRAAKRQAFLQARSDHPSDAATFIATQLTRDRAAPRAMLLLKSRLDRAEIDAATEQLTSAGSVVLRGNYLADAAWWTQLKAIALEAIDGHHRSVPQETGIRLTELRERLGRQAGQIFDLLAEELCQSGCARAGVMIRRTSHRPALPPHLQPAGARVRASLCARPLEPPSRKELTPDALTRQALRFLVQSGEAVEIGDELVLHADNYQRAIATIRAQLQTRGGASVSELKQALNTSRRVMVPLLEKLDREGITLRQGDKRILRPAR